MTRKLTVRKETLSELTSADLARAAGGSRPSFTIDGYPTWICTPLIAAVVEATTQAATRLTVVECAG